MFEEEKKQNNNINQDSKLDEKNKVVFPEEKLILGMFPYNKNIKIIFFILLSLAIIAFIFWGIRQFDFNFLKSDDPVVEEEGEEIVVDVNPEDSRISTGLPDNTDVEEPGNGDLAIDDIQVEYLVFSDFFNKPDNNYESQSEDISLPLNVKVDAVNYYDVSRKFNLDSGVESLNNNGFALFENPKPDEFTDFYGAYDWLYQKDIPLVITSDFLMYYYQYNLKKVFKEIEANVFYDNLWDINKALYQEARGRYEFNVRERGEINNPVLEAQRLVVAYLAVSLELLKPSPDQINSNTDLNDKSKFNPKDKEVFNFSLPDYLSEDVLKEVELIKEHDKETKSPVLLYDKNYNEFVIPKEYQENARLNNFYLTKKWLNSAFPLFHRDSECPDCLLDRDDWRINMIASQIISQDFSKNEKIKNKWARIYKVMSFFKGLRQNLTYVNYRDSLKNTLEVGDNFDSWFDKNNNYIDERLYKLQKDISTYKFSPIRGGYNSINEKNKPNVGLRILADDYWPNSYIFDNLTSPQVGFHQNQEDNLDLITACNEDDGVERCNGFGLDVINLISEVSEDNDYWRENTNYDNYNKQSNFLKNQLVNLNNLQGSNYWSNLNLINSIFNFSGPSFPEYAKNDRWQDRLIDTSLGSWVNFQIQSDSLGLYSLYGESDKKQGAGHANKYNYVEPNLPLFDNLIATTDMIGKMFLALKINDEAGIVGVILEEMQHDFSDLKKIVIKQNEGKALSQEDHMLIEDISREYVVREASDKTLKLDTSNSKSSFLSDISGINIIALLRYYEGRSVVVMGPVFNYTEK